MNEVVKLLLIAAGVWVAYEIFFAPSDAATTTTATGSTTPVTTTTTTPVTTAPPSNGTPATSTTPTTSTVATGGGGSSTPTGASFSLLSTPTPNVNNSLSANVSIAGGPSQNLSIIMSGSQAGTIWNTAGQNITSTITAQGISASGLMAAFQAAAGSGVSGLGVSRYGLGLPRFGFLAPPPVPVARPGQNYVPRGTPMRRVG